MTKRQVKKLYKEMEKFYGEKLANHIHHPKCFAHQVKVYKYLHEDNPKENIQG